MKLSILLSWAQNTMNIASRAWARNESTSIAIVYIGVAVKNSFTRTDKNTQEPQRTTRRAEKEKKKEILRKKKT